MKNAREVAFDVLKGVFADDAYSNLALDKAIKENNLSPQDSSFCTALVYGVLERCITLDYIIRKLSSVPFRKIEVSTLIILRLGIYQILYMDRVPDSAAVNECVKLAKEKKLFKSSGFINGLLRSFLRAEKEYALPPENDKNRRWSVIYSCPEYLVKLWRDSYGDEITEEILKSLSGRPPLCIHTNTLIVTPEELIEKLSHEGVSAEKSEVLDDLLNVTHSGAVDKLSAYRRGEFFVQDESSAICAAVTGVKSGDTVFDVCSAPGGKAFAMAMLMKGEGSIRAFDVHLHKMKLIESGAYRLKIKNLKASLRDAATDKELDERADVVLCDVPCSGFGIIRRKPEIRYRKEQNFAELPPLQYEILSNSARLVKEGGTLVYSTCTLNPEENGEVCKKFLLNHPEFRAKDIILPKGIEHRTDEPRNELTMFPHEQGGDGFFVATFERS